MALLTPSAPSNLDSIKRIGTGLAFILFPLLFIAGFALHPDLLNPHVLSPKELVLRARHADLMQWGHVLDTFGTLFLVVIALRFMKLRDRGSVAWAGLVGAALAIWGGMMLAALKGALCLTMSAIDTLPDQEFTQMMPGLLAMFSRKGWMVLLWGIVFLPIGFAIQVVPLVKIRAIPRWQGILFLIGMFLLGTPDGAEVISLVASILMAIGLIPYGIRTIARIGEWGGILPGSSQEAAAKYRRAAA